MALVEAYHRLPDLLSYHGEIEAVMIRILGGQPDAGPKHLPDYMRFGLHFRLEGLTPGLGREARSQGWRLLDAEPDVNPAFLLIPTYHRGKLVAVRSLRMLEAADSGLWPSGDYDLVPRVETVPGRPELKDAPAPHEEGLFDQDIVWVSVDPADALLLKSIGLHAVSLATPTRTLGSERGIRQLEDLGALDTQREPKKTIVVVDPGVTPDDGWGGLLRGLFDEVWQVGAAQPHYAAAKTVTGHLLAEVVRASRPLGFDQGREALRVLLGRVRDAGEECMVEPVRLPPRAAPGADVPLADAFDHFQPGEDFSPLRDFSALETRGETPTPKPPGQDHPDVHPFDVAPGGWPRAAYPSDYGRAELNRRLPDHFAGDKASFQIGDLVEGGEINWIAEPFIAARSITEVRGPSESGKSTFLASLAAAVTKGEHFLGRPCAHAQVIYVSEQRQESLDRQFSRAKASLEGVRFISSDKHWHLDLSQIVALVLRLLKPGRPGLVVFDTLFRMGKSERGKHRTRQHVNVLFETLQPLVNAGAGVVLVRHESGSDAVTEDSDASLVFKKSKSDGATRLIVVTSRFLDYGITLEVTKTGDGVEEVTHQQADLTQAQQRVSSTSSMSQGWAPRKNASKRARRSQIIDADVLGIIDQMAPLHPAVNDILAQLNGSDSKGYTEEVIRGSLRRLMEKGVVGRDPDHVAKKGAPHQYFRLREHESRSPRSPSGEDADRE